MTRFSLDGCCNVSGKCIQPEAQFKDVGAQLNDLREHQEQLFRKFLDQQMDIQSQLLAIHSDCKASVYRQDSLEQWRASQDADKVAKDAEKIITADELAKVAEKIITERGMELVGDACLPREPAQVKFEEVDSEPGSDGALRRTLSSTSMSSRRSQLQRRRSMRQINVHSWDANSQGSQSVKGCLDRILVSKEFELLVAGAIMINAFIMCWECQYNGLDVGFHLQYPGHHMEAHVVWAGANSAFTFLDWIFGSLFVLEMFAKLCCWRGKYFFDSEGWELESEHFEIAGWKREVSRLLWSVQGWNIADLSLVLTFLLDKAAAAFVSVNPQMLRMLRLVRLFRLVRLLRFLESLDHLYIMTTAISGLSKVLTWAVVLLTTMLTICGLFLVQMLHETYFNKVSSADLSVAQLERYHRMYEYFGTFTRCMLSMFEITLGNWPPVARLLSEEVSEWFTLICLLHKLTIGFAVIGVITGVILQETFKVAQTDDLIMFRQKKLARRILFQKMRTLFAALDHDFNGRLDLAEFQAIGKFPEIQYWLSSLDIETDDLTVLFSLIDIHGRGYITLDELVARMPRIAGNAKGIDMLAMSRDFLRS